MRVAIDIALFIFVINGWWPLVIVSGIIGAWYWPHFAELIVAGIAYDALFGMVGARGWIGTIVSILLYTIILSIKKFVRR